MTTEPQLFLGRTISASLTVKDLQRSLDWYQDVVGFTVDRRHEREGKLVAVSLKAGEIRLLIGQDDGAKGWDRAKGEGFSLHITTDQNIDALANRIKARADRYAVGPARVPRAGPGRIQNHDLLNAARVTAERHSEGVLRATQRRVSSEFTHSPCSISAMLCSGASSSSAVNYFGEFYKPRGGWREACQIRST